MPAEENEQHEYPKVAAMERGPGPGRYRLPPTVGHTQHDCRKKREPAFSFGSKLNPLADRIPGPGYAVDPSITRFGRDGTARFSMLGRHQPPKKFYTPGPGTYNPEIVQIDKGQTAPKHIIGQRTHLRRTDRVPAPNSYNIPPLIGSGVLTRPSGASHSMAKRLDFFSASYDLAKTPGPAAYNSIDPSTLKKRQGQFSMQGRTRKYVAERSIFPGPGAYNPENVSMNKPNIPKFSMGIRHSEYVTPLIVDVVDD